MPSCKDWRLTVCMLIAIVLGKADTLVRCAQLLRLRVSRDWDWMSTYDSLGQPYKSKCASLGQAVAGEMIILVTLTDPFSSCNDTSDILRQSQRLLSPCVLTWNRLLVMLVISVTLVDTFSS